MPRGIVILLHGLRRVYRSRNLPFSFKPLSRFEGEGITSLEPFHLGWNLFLLIEKYCFYFNGNHYACSLGRDRSNPITRDSSNSTAGDNANSIAGSNRSDVAFDSLNPEADDQFSARLLRLIRASKSMAIKDGGTVFLLNHCKRGQRLIINVLGSTAGLSPSPLPSTAAVSYSIPSSRCALVILAAIVICFFTHLVFFIFEWNLGD